VYLGVAQKVGIVSKRRWQMNQNSYSKLALMEITAKITISLTILAFLAIMLGGCGEDEPEPSASVTILDFEQDYIEDGSMWSDTVSVSYIITNTGLVSIDTYQIWFDAVCSGNAYRVYTGSAIGFNLHPGRSISDKAYIAVPRRQVVTVRVASYKLLDMEDG
jgi:hypothetical protein